MPWQQLTFSAESLSVEALESALLEAGALAITYTDAADQPILEPAPGETPMWHDARVTALFEESLAYERIALTLLQHLRLPSLPHIDVELLPDRAWEREWLARFKPMQFGQRLWVCPTHRHVDAKDAVVVSLDPGLAFGTGTHATTALCLARLEQSINGVSSMLDYGCGSGILAIAALKLGVPNAVAVDIDPQAITASRNNAELNGVEARVMLGEVALADDTTPYDLVIANILAGPLMTLAASISAHVTPGGRLLLSGILEEQASDVIAAYMPWIEFAPMSRQDGWVLLDGTRKIGD
ncbi:MAG: 50S ribosomal protein L11 methyltransferase [Pseudomonadota bacterium]